MIGLALLMLAQAVPPPAANDPIVVIGHRLQAIAVTVGQGPDKQWYCGMDGSTGRISLDKKLCKAVTKCVRRGAADDAAIQDCIVSTKGRLMRQLAHERAER